MAENKETQEVSVQVQSTAKKKAMKQVRNKSGYKVELVINGKVVVFLPGKIVEVPADFDIPNGLGLYVR